MNSGGAREFPNPRPRGKRGGWGVQGEEVISRFGSELSGAREIPDKAVGAR